MAPADCIMVGDRIDNDIVPAKALGMAAILLRSGRHRRQRPRSPAEEPDAVVTDVLELEAAIDATPPTAAGPMTALPAAKLSCTSLGMMMMAARDMDPLLERQKS